MAAPLDGQHAFITGGGSGIGLACARAFLAAGARVSLMGRSLERLERAQAELAALGAVHVYAGDVGVEAEVEAALAAMNARAPISIAVANAGVGGLAPLTATTDADWQHILQTNLSGTFYTFKHAAGHIALAGGGAMCAISSIAGVRTHRFMHAYAASKAAIDMLVRTSADELGAAGVRVNSVCPGLVDTEIAAGLFATDAVLKDYLDCMPVRRTGVPADIGNAVRFLCGPESSWITGVSLSVDGGHHLRRGPNYEPFIRPLFGDDLAEGRL
jgi:NAD(P)-dependent dehydrogenase (short-subunit alcohol dehydrogenase family)